jgi:diketogulonate reductase-like aldo/keto reductase
VGSDKQDIVFTVDAGVASTSVLNNGVRMPVLGLGVFQTPAGRSTREAVQAALAAGYRHIDTAAIYGNERDVGQAVRDSGVPREEVFITTKLWNDAHGAEAAPRAFEQSRRSLDTPYVDLYLIHWPATGKRVETWKALERLKSKGLCHAIGVSNFTIRHLEELLAQSDTVPAVNQVEFSPFLFQRKLLDYCRAHRIQLEAYAPLTKGRRLAHPVVRRAGAAHRATGAQVLIRWGLQHQVVEIPKSVHAERIRENAGAFGFELTAAEMTALDGLDEGFRTSWDPSEMP